jgi:hypothetical protein
MFPEPLKPLRDLLLLLPNWPIWRLSDAISTRIKTGDPSNRISAVESKRDTGATNLCRELKRSPTTILLQPRRKILKLHSCSTRTRQLALLAIDAEIIVEHSHRAVSIDSKVQGLVHQKVVPRTLADNPEVVYERSIRLAILERILKTLLRNAGPLVLCTGGLAGTANALWLEMEEATDIVAIDGERDKCVQGTGKVHNLSGTACSTGDEHGQIDICSIVDLYVRTSRTDHDSQRGNDAHHHS